MLNRPAKKKMGATPILLKPRSRLGGEPNCTPSDSAILAIFRDKRNQCAPYKGRCRAFRDACSARSASYSRSNAQDNSAA